MNKVILMGRLTRDPVVRVSQGERQMSIARYTLAVDRRGRSNNNNGENTADFISCVAFDRSAEFAERYLHQGSKILVTGHIQTGSYTNREGQKVYTTDVIVDEQEFAESKAASDRGAQNGGYTPNNGYGQNDYGQSSRSSVASNPQPTGTPADFMNIPDSVDDDGLPFN